MAPRPGASRREVEIEEDREDLDDKNPKGKDKLLDDSDLDDEGDEHAVEDEGLDNEEARREREEEEARRRQQEEPDDEDDARLAYSEDDEDDRPNRSRRQRRNRARREALAQKDRVIEQLAAQVNDLKGAFDQMSRGQLQIVAGDLEGRLRTETDNLRRIDAALADAVKQNDGDLYARAQRLRDEARDRIADIEAARYRLQQQTTQPVRETTEQQRQSQRQTPDPRAVRFSERFMERNPWFDMNGVDEDSQMVKAIDNALAAEGLRPETSRYWIELERRVKARGLGQDHEDYGDDMDDDGEDRTGHRPARRNAGLPPRAGRSGGGRPAGAGGFKLDAMMTDTLDQLGLLDEKNLNEDQKKQRRKYVSQWKAGTKAAAAARSR